MGLTQRLWQIPQLVIRYVQILETLNRKYGIRKRSQHVRVEVQMLQELLFAQLLGNFLNLIILKVNLGEITAVPPVLARNSHVGEIAELVREGTGPLILKDELSSHLGSLVRCHETFVVCERVLALGISFDHGATLVVESFGRCLVILRTHDEVFCRVGELWALTILEEVRIGSLLHFKDIII